MKKFLSLLLLLVIVCAGGLYWFATSKPSSPFDGPDGSSGATGELVAKGELVARQSDCVACHSTPDSKPFSGGLEMGTPLGSIFATNITPDKNNGIGGYTLADFDRAVRHGVAVDGSRLYPAMPYPSYAKLDDGDVRALYAFFMNGVQPAAVPNRKSAIPWPLSMRWPLALWNAVFFETGSYTPKPSRDPIWNRGAYLVQAAGHCGACHTPRAVTMNEKALDESSPLFLSGALLDGWYAPSLRQDHNTGLGRWSEEDIFAFLKNGRNQHAVVFGSMAEAYNNSTQYMTDDDLKAMAHYLKSLPGDDSRDGKPWLREPSGMSAASSTPAGQTFAAKCSFCHGADGQGQNQWIPPLAGSAASLIDVTDSQVNVTLNGSARVVAAGVPDAYRMPAFREQLSDQQIADVLSYVRSSWGNHSRAVDPKDVTSLRGRSGPASSSPIILQMR